MTGYALGIDLGTSKIALVAISYPGREILMTKSQPANAYMEFSEPWRKEQNVRLIQEVVSSMFSGVIRDIPMPLLSIGITGQMHGIIGLDKNKNPITNLVTWEDQRGNELYHNGESIIEQMSYRCGRNDFASGYGLVTLEAWRKFDMVEGIKSICTLPDYIGYNLFHLDPGRIAPSMAHSLGGFDLKTMNWDNNALAALGLDQSELPEICQECSVGENFFIDGRVVPVIQPLGDSQAAFLGATSNVNEDILLNIGTGAQLSYTVDIQDEEIWKLTKDNPDVDIRPFLDNRYLLSANSLNGGNVYASLHGFFRLFLEHMGTSVEDEILWDKMDELASKNDAPFQVTPVLNGMRSDPHTCGIISGIDTNNFTPANLIYSWLRGMAQHYRELGGDFCRSKKGDFYGSGNGVRKNPRFRKIIEEVFNRTLHIPTCREEAAMGAAVLSLDAIHP